MSNPKKLKEAKTIDQTTPYHIKYENKLLNFHDKLSAKDLEDISFANQSHLIGGESRFQRAHLMQNL